MNKVFYTIILIITIGALVTLLLIKGKKVPIPKEQNKR